MSFVNVVPDILAAAAGNLESIGSALTEANAAAVSPTTGLAAMAADEVSAAVTAAFATHAQQYQAFSAQAAAFHDQFVRTLNTGLGAYVGTEANVEKSLLNAVNAPATALLGQPLIGTGQAGAAAASAAEAIPPVVQSFDFPLGPLQVSGSIMSTVEADGSVFGSGSGTAVLNGPSGPVTLLSASGTANLPVNGTMLAALNATTPFGPVGLSVTGTAMGGSDPTFQFTGGTINVPPEIPLLLAAQLGPSVAGGASLVDSSNAFYTALSTGNVQGATEALFTTPIDFSDAVLFGETTVTFPDSSWAVALGFPPGMPLPQVHIPFGGVFADPQPITVTVPTISSSEGTLLGSTFALQGTQFGGIGPLLLNALGIPT